MTAEQKLEKKSGLSLLQKVTDWKLSHRALAEKQKDFDKMPSNIQHRIEDVNKTSYSALLRLKNKKAIVCMGDGEKSEIGHNTDSTEASEMSGDIAKKLENVKSGLRK